MPKSKKRVRKTSNRQRPARRTADAACEVYRSPPPSDLYDEWFPIDEMKAVAERSDKLEALGSEDALAYALLVKLGPIYGGKVPAAAVELHEQIESGAIRVAIDGMHGLYTEMEIGALIAQVPGSGSDEDDQERVLHVLHALGQIVLDDDGTVNLSTPPSLSETGEWELNGYPDTWATSRVQ